MIKTIADTSAIISAIKRNETNHLWAADALRNSSKPLFTCESVVSEASFLLQPSRNDRQGLFKMLTSGMLQIDFSLASEIDNVTSLMTKYQNVPMSLADACLVRMCELEKDSRVFTLDSDFYVYRKHGRYHIPILIPDTI